MAEKIKVLMVGLKETTFTKSIERHAPGRYEFIYCGFDASVEFITMHKPEIIKVYFIAPGGKDKEFVKKVKQVHSAAAVFINYLDYTPGDVEDEEAFVDEILACGAYKCNLSDTFHINTIAHDMHVALNLEEKK